MLELNALAKALTSHNNLPSNVIILAQTNQLRAMTTIIRDKDTDPEDHIFYLERASGRVIERYLNVTRKLTKSALDELPYSPKKVETPTGHQYKGQELSAQICGVEIVRAGGAMRTSFSRIFVDAPIGKILIHTSDIGEPMVHILIILTLLITASFCQAAKGHWSL